MKQERNRPKRLERKKLEKEILGGKGYEKFWHSPGNMEAYTHAWDERNTQKRSEKTLSSHIYLTFRV